MSHVLDGFIENLVSSGTDSCERGMGFKVWLQSHALRSIHFGDCFDQGGVPVDVVAVGKIGVEVIDGGSQFGECDQAVEAGGLLGGVGGCAWYQVRRKGVNH